MVVGHIDSLGKKVILNPQVQGTSVSVLVSPKEGWEGYVMRVFEVEPGGFTPKHQHPWPHINYILEGQGDLMINGEHHEIKPGSYAYVPKDTLHQFKNPGDQVFKFICIVPEEGHII